MRDKMQLAVDPYRNRRSKPSESAPMKVSLRQRWIEPIPITEKMQLRHHWYRKLKEQERKNTPPRKAG